MEVTERADGVVVINDAYNANPESMRAALEALAAIGRGARAAATVRRARADGRARRRTAPAEHDALGAAGRPART